LAIFVGFFFLRGKNEITNLSPRDGKGPGKGGALLKTERNFTGKKKKKGKKATDEGEEEGGEMINKFTASRDKRVTKERILSSVAGGKGKGENQVLTRGRFCPQLEPAPRIEG